MLGNKIKFYRIIKSQDAATSSLFYYTRPRWLLLSFSTLLLQKTTTSTTSVQLNYSAYYYHRQTPCHCCWFYCRPIMCLQSLLTPLPTLFLDTFATMWRIIITIISTLLLKSAAAVNSNPLTSVINKLGGWLRRGAPLGGWKSRERKGNGTTRKGIRVDGGTDSPSIEFIILNQITSYIADIIYWGCGGGGKNGEEDLPSQVHVSLQ